MKRGKFLIPALAMLMCVSAGAGFAAFTSTDAKDATVKAEDSGFMQLSIGDNTIAITDEDISSGMVVGMFTVETAGYYTFLSDDLVVSVGDLEGNVIGAGSLELAAGDYFILLGTDTISTAGNYIATIMEGVPEVGPTVYEVGKMYSSSNGGSTGGFYFTMPANAAPYDGSWALRYKPVSADAVKRTRNGETTNVGNTAAETIVKYTETDYYVEGWTVGNFEEGDVFTIEGDFINEANNAVIRIEQTTVTYTNGAFKFSTDPVVHNAGQMYAHEAGTNPNGDGEGTFAFYFKTAANDAAYNSDWTFEYGAMSADNIKLTRNGETTSVAKTGQGLIVKYGETDHYMKLVPWTTEGLLPLQDGDVLTISGVFACTKDSTQRFEIEETTITYSADNTVAFSTDPEVHEAGYMSAHENGANPNGDGEGTFAFYFKTAANDAAYNSDWTFEYGAISADNIKLTRNGATTSVAKTGQGTVVRISEVDHYIKLVPWTTEGLLPLQEGDVLTIGGVFVCTRDSMQRFRIAETTLAYRNGEIVYLNPSYTFVDEDGTVLKETGVLAYGSMGEAPANPTKAATAEYTYTFDNWYVGDEVFDPAKAYEGNVVVTAKYTATVNPYTVTVKQAGAEDKTFQFGVEAAGDLIAASDVAAELAKYLPETTAELEYVFEEEMPETFALQDYTFTITSAVRKYTVTVITGNPRLNPESVTTSEMEYNSTITLTEPTAEGKTFAGWIDVEGNEVTDFTVKGDMAIYASWNVTAYTVTIKEAGKDDQTFKFGVETVEGIDCDLAAVAYALSTYLPEDTADYTYAWAETVPKTFELKDYTFTVVATEVEVEEDSSSSVEDSTSAEESESVEDSTSAEESVDAPADTTDEEPADDGCGSVIGGVALGAVALAGAAMLIRKKKED